MRFTVNSGEFFAALSTALRTAATRSTIPALEGVYVAAANGEITVTGYDMETAVVSKVAADVEREGEIVVMKQTVEIIRRSPSDDVLFELEDEDTVHIRSGSSEFSVKGIIPSDYPKLPDLFGGGGTPIPRDALKNMIGKVIYAVSQNSSKGVHTGGLLDFDGEGNLNAVALDGFRLAVRRAVTGGDLNKKLVVPAKALKEVERLLSGDNGESVSVSNTGKFVRFDVGNFSVMSRLLDGEFLDYKKTLPQNLDKKLNVEVRAVIDCAERVSLLAEDAVKSPLKLKIRDGEITFTMRSATGRAGDSCPCEGGGFELEIGFNHKYFLEMMKSVLPEERAIMSFLSPLSPVLVEPEEGDEFSNMLLPVRL